MKITNRTSINAEYNILPGNQVVSSNLYNSFLHVVDFRKGGQVFQLVITNSRGMIGPTIWQKPVFNGRKIISFLVSTFHAFLISNGKINKPFFW